ncbi:MAG: hypothetical protein KAT70_03420 [Thermoplasmata archaeon]|nr:hypothetical protein [Thermoplasmata archaeon]
MKIPLHAQDLAVTYFLEAQAGYLEDEAFSVSVERLRGSTRLWLNLKAIRVVNDRLFTQTRKMAGTFFCAILWESALQQEIRKLVLAVREESKK